MVSVTPTGSQNAADSIELGGTLRAVAGRSVPRCSEGGDERAAKMRIVRQSGRVCEASRLSIAGALRETGGCTRGGGQQDGGQHRPRDFCGGAMRRVARDASEFLAFANGHESGTRLMAEWYSAFINRVRGRAWNPKFPTNRNLRYHRRTVVRTSESKRVIQPVAILTHGDSLPV